MGYVNNSYSERAEQAMNHYRMPLSRIDKDLIEEIKNDLDNETFWFNQIEENIDSFEFDLNDIDDQDAFEGWYKEAISNRKFTVKEIKENKDYSDAEWHHMSAMYNAIDFYSVPAIMVGIIIKENEEYIEENFID